MNLAPYQVTLRQLQYAVAVADSLSFRKAAVACFVSQPALSTQLAQMERALGIRLFERGRRGVILTVAGQGFIERARLILRDTGDLEALARCATDPLSGTLRIGVIPTISPYLLPRLTPALRKDYPRLKISWVEDKTAALVRSLETGALDAVLLALEADIGEVEREIIARDPFVLVAPRGHALAASKAHVDVAELRDATVLVLQEGHCLGEQSAAFCTRTSASVDAFRGTSLTTVVQMVAGGAGVTLVPALALTREAMGPELCIRNFSGKPPGRTIGLVWRQHYAFDNALRQVAATIRRAYPPSPSDTGLDSPTHLPIRPIRRGRMRA